MAIRQQQVFTTGQIARICSLSTRTVAQWCSSGKLGGYRSLRKHRRISRQELIKFFREQGMLDPLHRLLGKDTNVLLVDVEVILVDRILKDLSAARGYFVEQSSSKLVDLTHRLQHFVPGCVVINYQKNVKSVQRVVKTIRAEANCSDTLILVLKPTIFQNRHLDKLVNIEQIDKPLRSDELIARIIRAVPGHAYRLPAGSPR